MSLVESAAAVDGAFTTIPIIGIADGPNWSQLVDRLDRDLGECCTPEGRLAAALEIRDACIRVGFFYIRNHGIPQGILDRVFTAVQRFFSLSMAVKMKLYHRTVANFKGYNPTFDSNVDPADNDKGDFHEGFEIGWEEIVAKAYDEKRENDGAMAGANQWPLEDYPGFREAVLEYYHAAVNVGRALFPLFALALDLPETYFDEKTRNSAAIMKTLHYPLRDGYPKIDDNTPGIGAHSDFQCFTILWQQPEVQALQLRNTEQRWIDAPPIKDTLVINIGDQLAMWSNDVFKSTVHRAINKSGRERYSIALFFGTDHHVNIEPIPSCVSPERPAKYGSVIAGDYVKKRLTETRTYHKS